MRNQKEINRKISETLKKKKITISDKVKEKISIKIKEKWKSGDYDFKRKKLKIEDICKLEKLNSKHKHFIIEYKGGKCERCKWNKIHPITLTSLLQVHHNDGNNKNNKIKNLLILCPNCHSMTDNYMFYGRTHK